MYTHMYVLIYGDTGCSYIQVVPCHPVATNWLIYSRINNRILTELDFNC